MSTRTEPSIGRKLPGVFWLADEMRLGKTKQVIDTAQVLYERKQLDTVMVVCPAPVRGVWFDETLGEIQKHRWENLPVLVVEYHAQIKKWAADVKDINARHLTWIITNFEYLRHGVRRESGGWSGPNLNKLLKTAGPRTMLVIDESSYVSHPTSLQSRACLALRNQCGWVTLLNGTPMGESPEDIFGQAKLLDWRILMMKYITHFRARYAIMGGYSVNMGNKRVPVEVVGWRHVPTSGCCNIPAHLADKTPVHGLGPGLEEVQAMLAPYVLRRLRNDCLDLPPKLDPVILEARLTQKTWDLYRTMRDDAVAWLDAQTVSMAAQAGVHVLRLSQVTSGFLGGLYDQGGKCLVCLGQPNNEDCDACQGSGQVSLAIAPLPVGREKLDVLLDWTRQRLAAEPDLRMIAWGRFRSEVFRAHSELSAIKGLLAGLICGGQKRDERAAALQLVHPQTSSNTAGGVVLTGTLGTGSFGIDMSGAHEVIYMSNDSSLLKRQQSEDRPMGPGQTSPVSYHDIVAVGPKGQQTIDHVIMQALSYKQDLSRWTCAAWKTALEKE